MSKPADMTAERRSAAIDWRAIDRKLDAYERRFAADAEVEPEVLHAILQQRAHALARDDHHLQLPAAPPRAMLLFRLCDAPFAIDVAFLHEVLRIEVVTAIAGAPAHVAGIVNRRGSILMLVDLARLLGLERAGLVDQTRAIVVGSGKAVLGLLVDGTDGIAELLPEEISPPVRSEEHVEGIARGRVVVLAGESLVRTCWSSGRGQPGAIRPGL